MWLYLFFFIDFYNQNEWEFRTCNTKYGYGVFNWKSDLKDSSCKQYVHYNNLNEKKLVCFITLGIWADHIPLSKTTILYNHSRTMTFTLQKAIHVSIINLHFICMYIHLARSLKLFNFRLSLINTVCTLRFNSIPYTPYIV